MSNKFALSFKGLRVLAVLAALALTLPSCEQDDETMQELSTMKSMKTYEPEKSRPQGEEDEKEFMNGGG